METVDLSHPARIANLLYRLLENGKQCRPSNVIGNSDFFVRSAQDVLLSVLEGLAERYADKVPAQVLKDEIAGIDQETLRFNVPKNELTTGLEPRNTLEKKEYDPHGDNVVRGTLEVIYHAIATTHDFDTSTGKYEEGRCGWGPAEPKQMVSR